MGAIKKLTKFFSRTIDLSAASCAGRTTRSLTPLGTTLSSIAQAERPALNLRSPRKGDQRHSVRDRAEALSEGYALPRAM